MRDIRPIRNDADLAWALAEISLYFEDLPEPGSAEGDRFDVLSDLVEAYENRHHPVDDPDPASLLRSFLEMTGRTQADLAGVLGSRPRASEVLSGKRSLSLDMIRRLHSEWGLPVAVLLGVTRKAA